MVPTLLSTRSLREERTTRGHSAGSTVGQGVKRPPGTPDAGAAQTLRTAVTQHGAMCDTLVARVRARTEEILAGASGRRSFVGTPALTTGGLVRNEDLSTAASLPKRPRTGIGS